MNEPQYIGMDVHQASIVCAVHNPAGKCVARSIIETKAETVRDFLRGYRALSTSPSRKAHRPLAL